MNTDFFTTLEVAKLLGISRTAVLKKIKSGVLPAQKIGRDFIIKKSDLPIEAGGELTDQKKQLIERAVEKTVDEYGEALRLLGNQ